MEARVLFVRGEPEARGRALGEQTRALPGGIERAVDLPLARLEQAVHRALPAAPPAARAGGVRLLRATVTEPLAGALSQRATAFLRGFAAGCAGRRSERDVRAAALEPDVLALLAGTWPVTRASAARLACSTLVALPRLTESGELAHARALERAPLADDEPPLVIVHQPARGHRFWTLHHGGALTSGVTGGNDAGLVLSVHGAHTTRVRARGAAVFDVATELLETCRDLTGARALLARRPTAAGWLFVLSDARRGRAVALECDADGPAALYPPGEFLAAAGALRTRKDRFAFAPTGAWRELEWSRLARLNAHARESAGAHTPASLAAALFCDRDAYAPEQRRPFGNVVAQPDCLDLVVCAPAADGLWLQTAPGPRSSPAPLPGLRLSALFAGRAEALPPLPAPAADDALVTARRELALAQRELDDDDAAGALTHLDAARAALPEESGLALLRAATLLREGFALDARELCEPAIARETSPYRRGLLALTHARALSQLGHRREARASYDRVAGLAGGVDDGLAARARREVDRDFSLARAHALYIDALRCDVRGP